MPVRIYDISKKLGLENKEILSKAKELGIAAKVPSSSLDKITAEYLEEELRKAYPHLAAPVVAPPVPAPAPIPNEPIRVISAPKVKEPELVVAKTEPEISAIAAPIPSPKEKSETAVVELPPELKPEPPKPISPPPPAGPKLGEKIGFVQLPSKPAPRQPEKPPARSPQTPKTDFIRRGDIRSVRGGSAAPSSQSLPGQRTGRYQAPAPAKPAEPKFVPPVTDKVITIKPPIIVRDLAEQLQQKPIKIIADLMELRFLAHVNQSIDEAIAQRVCAKYGYRFEVEKRDRTAALVHAPAKVEVEVEEHPDKPEDLKPRAPVVTIMGHVDHGKTSLLDVIRKANVAAGEAGGITQHIGAYTISFPHPERKKDLQQITFLDTPGHEAFSAMRARGANVTDIVILVVAANDGVMPQTLEALNHAKAAKVPILVAVNKCDHPNANPMKVRQQLQEKGLVPDDWGGETIFVDCSAMTKQGVDKLLEMVLLQAELLELKANPGRLARGNVIESGLEPGGPTATVLVRKGTLHLGDIIICGQFFGRVRALISEEGKRLKEAGPSVAVRVLGLNGVPEAGLEFSVVEDEKAARELAEKRSFDARVVGQEARAKVTLENLFDTLAQNKSKVLKLVVKADTQGSVEAIVEALKKIDSEKISLEIIHNAVGTITESDVLLASASQAVILGFHTRLDSVAAELAKRENVQIKLYAIIYELIDQVKESMAGLLDPLLKEVVIGSAEVRKVFELSKGVPVAGCMVVSGRIAKGKVRVRRKKDTIFEGIAQSLRRFQDEVNEVRAGMECGIRLESYSDFQVGDFIESYNVEKVAQKL